MPIDRDYPLERREDDPRFTIDLALDVAAVIARHGYPEIRNGIDLVHLQEALFRFLYRPDGEPS